MEISSLLNMKKRERASQKNGGIQIERTERSDDYNNPRETEMNTCIYIYTYIYIYIYMYTVTGIYQEQEREKYM